MAGFSTPGQGTNEGNQLLLGAVKAELSTTSKLRLYQAGFSPGPANVEADFESHEATFSGYSAATITWGAVGTDADGNAVMYSNDCVYQATDAAAPNNIGGCWISAQTAAGPPPVNGSVEWFPFPVPVPMVAALALLRAVVGKVMGPGADSVDVAF